MATHTMNELLHDKQMLSYIAIYVVGDIVSFILMVLLIAEVKWNSKLQLKKVRVAEFWLYVLSAWLAIFLSWFLLLVSIPMFFYYRGKNKELEQENFWH